MTQECTQFLFLVLGNYFDLLSFLYDFASVVISFVLNLLLKHDAELKSIKSYKHPCVLVKLFRYNRKGKQMANSMSTIRATIILETRKTTSVFVRQFY